MKMRKLLAAAATALLTANASPVKAETPDFLVPVGIRLSTDEVAFLGIRDGKTVSAVAVACSPSPHVRIIKSRAQNSIDLSQAAADICGHDGLNRGRIVEFLRQLAMPQIVAASGDPRP